jgi:hypothetical protein
MLLAGDESLREWLYARLSEQAIQKIEGICRRLEGQHHEPLGFLVNQRRLNTVDRFLDGIFQKERSSRGRAALILGNVTTHPVWGIPFLLFVLYGMYKLVGDFGAGMAVDFMQKIVFGKGINPAATRAVEYLFAGKFFQDLLVGPYGLVTMGLTYAVAIVLPIVGAFFFAFGLLEKGEIIDVEILVTALLHDVVEDTWVTLEDIEREFGINIKKRVQLLTKPSKVRSPNQAKRESKFFKELELENPAISTEPTSNSIRIEDIDNLIKTESTVPTHNPKKIDRPNNSLSFLYQSFFSSFSIVIKLSITNIFCAFYLR